MAATSVRSFVHLYLDSISNARSIYYDKGKARKNIFPAGKEKKKKHVNVRSLRASLSISCYDGNNCYLQSRLTSHLRPSAHRTEPISELTII